MGTYAGKQLHHNDKSFMEAAEYNIWKIASRDKILQKLPERKNEILPKLCAQRLIARYNATFSGIYGRSRLLSRN